MLAVVLALASAIGYGSSDFAAGLASRSAPVIQITLLASVISGVIVAAALPFAASPGPNAAALAWGFAAGLGGTLGAFALYLGFRHAAFSVAGPLSAVASAGFSVLAGLLYGERPTTLALTGIVLALPAIVGVSVSAGAEEARAERQRRPHGGGRPRGWSTACSRGRVSRCCSSGWTRRVRTAGCGRWPRPRSANWRPRWSRRWPCAALRCAAAGRGCWRLIAGAGGAGGTILFFLATHQGFLAVTAVLTSLYPAVTIVLARTVLGERLTGAAAGRPGPGGSLRGSYRGGRGRLSSAS